MSGEQLQFIDYRKPKLEAGEYEFSTQHRYQGEGEDDTAKLHVIVSGERTRIDDSQIFGRYPPPGESGDFADTLPHIAFTKGTLPWIRSAYDVDDETSQGETEVHEPWLFVMVLNDNDFEAGRARDFKPCALHELNNGAYFPSAQLNALRNDKTLTKAQKTMSSVVIKKPLFNDLLLNNKATHNDKDQLEHLAHIRRRWQAVGSPVNQSAAFVSTLNNLAASADQSNMPSVLSAFNIPSTAKAFSVVSEGKTWLIQDAVKGDCLLDVVSDDGSTVAIQMMTLARELSVLMANRFGQNAASSKSSGRNMALVVSLEQYLTEDSLNAIDALSDDAALRFIVLTSWEFDCVPKPIGFEQRSKKLTVNALKYADHDINLVADNGDFGAKFHAGMVPLPHTLRNNDRGLSWYRGPLVPTVQDDSVWKSVQLSQQALGQEGEALVATDADKFLRYHPSDGMLDVSYAAAYELGRVLSLKQTEFLKNLQQYKKSKSRYIKLAASDAQRMAQVQDLGIHIEELPYAQLNASAMSAQRQVIEQWLMQLAHLSNIPSWYLVPDNRLLPPRSLRTFNVDPVWIQALWLGALSLDGRPQVTHDMFTEIWSQRHADIPRAGAFLRSDIVWAYPALIADFRNIDELAVDIADDQTTDLRQLALNHFTSVKANIDLGEMKADFEDDFADLIAMHPAIEITDLHSLDNDLSLYLTKSRFDYVSLSLPPESLHYGADFDKAANRYSKDIKYLGNTIASVELAMANQQLAILDVESMVSRIKLALSTHIHNEIASETDTERKTQLQRYYNNLSQFRSARVGRFMLEGEPKVEFTVGREEVKSS